MIIRRMKAVFGRLSGEELELGEGLNIIQGPNESGKSTWCTFIKAMLYGINSSERDRGDYIAVKNKFRPWNGQNIEGTMDLYCEGESITIIRGPQAAAQMKQISCVYSGTTEPVERLKGQAPGQVLLGISERVFERSAFIGQADIKTRQTPELEKKIAAIISENDDFSFTEVSERLKTWQHKRKFNKSGMLPELENQIRQTDCMFSAMEEENRQLGNIQLDVEQLAKSRDRLKNELELIELFERRREREKMSLASKDMQRLKAELYDIEKRVVVNGIVPESQSIEAAAQAVSRLKEAQNDAAQADDFFKSAKGEQQMAAAEKEAFGFGDTATETVKNRIDENVKEYERFNKRKSVMPPLYLFICILLLGLSGYIFAAEFAGIILMATVLAAFCVAVWLAVIIKGNRYAAAKQKTILQDYGVDDIEKLREIKAGYESACDRKIRADDALSLANKERMASEGKREQTVMEYAKAMHRIFEVVPGIGEAEEKIRDLRCNLENYNKTKAEYDASAKIYAILSENFRNDTDDIRDEIDIPPFIADKSREKTEKLLEETEAELESAMAEYNIARGKLKAMGDPIVLAANRRELKDRYDKLKEEYDSLTMAISVLSEANAEMQARFAPVLSHRAGEIMDDLTGGRYCRLLFDSGLDCAAEQYGSTVARNHLYLSRGTDDQIYLALRLAICDVVLPSGESIPLIMDDSLVNFDETRMAAALELLREISENRQVLLFTCHSRESDYFENDNAVNKIYLRGEN